MYGFHWVERRVFRVAQDRNNIHESSFEHASNDEVVFIDGI